MDACRLCALKISTEGEHRLASISCGHTYGESCIRDWLSRSAKVCPKCRAPSSTEDVARYYIDQSHITLAARSQKPSQNNQTDDLVEAFEDALIRFEDAWQEQDALAKDLQEAETALSEASLRVDEVNSVIEDTHVAIDSMDQAGLTSRDIVADIEKRILNSVAEKILATRVVEELRTKVATGREIVSATRGQLALSREQLLVAMMK